MINGHNIKPVSEAKADQLYHALKLCTYCKTPFRDCDTIIPGKCLSIGDYDVVEYRKAFWHYGCIFDYKKDKGSIDK